MLFEITSGEIEKKLNLFSETFVTEFKRNIRLREKGVKSNIFNKHAEDFSQLVETGTYSLELANAVTECLGYGLAIVPFIGPCLNLAVKLLTDSAKFY